MSACFEEKSCTAGVKLCSLSLGCSCFYCSDSSNSDAIRHLHGFILFVASCCLYSCQHWWGESGHGLVVRIFVPVLVCLGEGIAALGEGAAFSLLGSSSELFSATWGCFSAVREPSRSRSTPSSFFQQSFGLVTFSQETVVSKFNSLQSKWLSPVFGIDYLSIKRQGGCPDLWWSGQDEIIRRLYVPAGCLHWLPCSWVCWEGSQMKAQGKAFSKSMSWGQQLHKPPGSILKAMKMLLLTFTGTRLPGKWCPKRQHKCFWLLTAASDLWLHESPAWGQCVGAGAHWCNPALWVVVKITPVSLLWVKRERNWDTKSWREVNRHPKEAIVGIGKGAQTSCIPEQLACASHPHCQPLETQLQGTASSRPCRAGYMLVPSLGTWGKKLSGWPTAIREVCGSILYYFLWLLKQSCNYLIKSTQSEKILLSYSIIVFLKTHFPFYMD